MPRSKKTVVYDADADTIRRYFERSMAAHDEAASAKSLIAETNIEMEDAGVHSGVMSFCRRIARLKPGRRGYMAFLTIRYLQILREEVHDPEGPQLEALASGGDVPFGQRAA